MLNFLRAKIAHLLSCFLQVLLPKNEVKTEPESLQFPELDSRLLGDAGPLPSAQPIHLPDFWKKYESCVIVIGASHHPSMFPVYLDRVDTAQDVLYVRQVHVQDQSSERTLASVLGEPHRLERKACYFVAEIPATLH